MSRSSSRAEVLAELTGGPREKPISSHEAGPFDLIKYSAPQLVVATLCLVFCLIGFFVKAEEGPIVSYIIGTICACLTLAALYWAYGRASKIITLVELFPSGVVWRDGKKWYAVPWHQIAEVVRTEVRVNGSVQTREIAIKSKQSERGIFTYALPRWNKLADTIQMQTTTLLVPPALAAFAAGQTVPFGKKVALSQEALTIEGKEISWDRIKDIQMGNGALVVYTREKRANCKMASFGEMPNYLVFLKLLEQTPFPEPGPLK